MGIHDDTKKPLTAFESERGIPTSEFSTVLSRILYQYKYDNNGNGAYYATHYKAMKENNFVNSPLDKIQTYNDALASFSKAAKTLKSCFLMYLINIFIAKTETTNATNIPRIKMKN